MPNDQVIDVSGIETQHRSETKSFRAAPPDVDMVILGSLPSGGGSDGEISVKGISPAKTAPGYEYDLDGADSWANTTGVFTGLTAGTYTVQARDDVTTANVSIVLTFVIG